jgi:hypothetical protein
MACFSLLLCYLLYSAGFDSHALGMKLPPLDQAMPMKTRLLPFGFSLLLQLQNMCA